MEPMKPKDIARLISEDPDVLNEAYCEACGGSDDDPFTDPTARGWGGKVMRGHRYNCPTGAPMGSPIGKRPIGDIDAKGPEPRTAQPGIESMGIYVPALLPNGEVWEGHLIPDETGEDGVTWVFVPDSKVTDPNFPYDVMRVDDDGRPVDDDGRPITLG